MNKDELLNQIEAITEQEEYLSTLTAQKIAAFNRHQAHVIYELRRLVKEYFPQEILKLMYEYSQKKNINPRTDLLWTRVYISYDGTYDIHISLNPNKYTMDKFGTKCIPTYIPKTLDELKLCIEKFQNYELLLKVLQSDIELIYDEIADWKNTQLKMDFELLYSIKEDISSSSQRHPVKIQIIIKEVNS